MMKLVTEYSYPGATKLLGAYHSSPFVDKKQIMEGINMMLATVTKHIDSPGFKMTMRVVPDDNKG